MSELIKKEKVLSSFIWSFGERILAQIVSLVVGVVLARLLTPDDYGAVSIVMVFITICNVFVTSGFGTAIVRQKEASSVDFNTAFFLSFFVSILLYVVIFISAPYIAQFYENEILQPVMRVLGIWIILSAFSNIQQAYLQRQMKFKKFFIASLVGTSMSCVVGIGMALADFGVWALVAQYLTNTTINTAVLFFVGDWKPKVEFSIHSVKSIYSFGWKMLGSNLIYTLSNDIRSLIIGKVFGSSDLAYYDQGKKYPAVIVDNVDVAIAKVMLPTFSRAQSDLKGLKELLRKSIRVGIYIVAPLMCGFAAVANSFVVLILSEKWLSAVPFIQIMCIAYMTRPLEELCHRVTLAIGKSGTVMVVMAVINGVSLMLTVVAAFVLRSVLWIALFYLVHTLVSLLCFMFIANRNLAYRVNEQLSDITPAILISAVMAVCVWGIGMLEINIYILLALQVIIGIVVYCILSKLFGVKEFMQIKKIICSYFVHKDS